MRIPRGVLSTALTVLATVWLPATISGQTYTATVTGTVVDPGGAAVPKVKVVAVNQATKLANSAETSDAGVYRIPFLPVGTYLVTEIVLVETEAVWRRQVDDAIAEVRQTFADLNRKTSGLVDDATLKWPKSSALNEKYSSGTSDRFQAWQIISPKLPDLSLEKALTLAARHEPPFPTADIGFRDAMVMTSLVEAVDKGSVLGVLADDKYFSDARAGRAAGVRGIELRVFKTRREILNKLETMARLTDLAKFFADAEREQERVLALLRDDRDNVESYVRASLKIPQFPAGLDAYVRRVDDIRVDEIRTVHISPFKPMGEASADIGLKVQASVVPTTPAEPRQLSIGQETGFGGFRDPEVVEFDGNAVLTVRLTKQGVEYAAVRYETDLERSFKRAALLKALTGESGK